MTMGSFGISSGSPQIDADTLEELEYIRRRLESLSDEVGSDEAQQYIAASVQDLDHAMRALVDLNIDDPRRFSDLLSRFGVPSEIVEKVIERTKDE